MKIEINTKKTKQEYNDLYILNKIDIYFKRGN